MTPASNPTTILAPRLPLVRHPATPCSHALALQAGAAWEDAGHLRLEYRLAGNWRGVLLPQRNDHPVPQPELWRHTCFEAFVGTPGSTAYHEFNFSPSGDWAVFAFSSWRQRIADCSGELQPIISLSTAASTLHLVVRTPLPAAHGHRMLGLSAVLEHHDGRRCYWALAHPCDDPDFHARAGWLATLPPAPARNT